MLHEFNVLCYCSTALWYSVCIQTQTETENRFDIKARVHSTICGCGNWEGCVGWAARHLSFCNTQHIDSAYSVLHNETVGMTHAYQPLHSVVQR